MMVSENDVKRAELYKSLNEFLDDGMDPIEFIIHLYSLGFRGTAIVDEYLRWERVKNMITTARLQ